MKNTAQYDLIIVGGGMVGATLACALQGAGLTIALLEQNPPEAFSADQPHDLRVSALSIASQRILQHVGAWQGVATTRLCPYQRMRVWEQAGWGDTLFDSKDINAPALGYIVENRLVQLALWQQLGQPTEQGKTAAGRIDIISPAAIAAIRYQPAGSEVQLDDGRILQSALLVAADGGQSQVRQAVGIGVHRWQYAQQALVAYVETAYPQQDITWQRFVPGGPQAFLPLTGQRASIVWYEQPDEVKRLLALPDEDFRQQLLASFPMELGEIPRVIRRAYFPLSRQHALSYCKQGVVLIGDAAHMIHPLAGQGVNIGLLDAAVLAEVLLAALADGEDIANTEVLGRYEAKRRQHNRLMMTLMDAFYRVFRDEHVPVKVLRNLGLGLAQNLKPAKQQAMAAAMGVDLLLPLTPHMKAGLAPLAQGLAKIAPHAAQAVDYLPEMAKAPRT